MGVNVVPIKEKDEDAVSLGDSDGNEAPPSVMSPPPALAASAAEPRSAPQDPPRPTANPVALGSRLPPPVASGSRVPPYRGVRPPTPSSRAPPMDYGYGRAPSRSGDRFWRPRSPSLERGRYRPSAYRERSRSPRRRSRSRSARRLRSRSPRSRSPQRWGSWSRRDQPSAWSSRASTSNRRSVSPTPPINPWSTFPRPEEPFLPLDLRSLSVRQRIRPVTPVPTAPFPSTIPLLPISGTPTKVVESGINEDLEMPEATSEVIDPPAATTTNEAVMEVDPVETASLLNRLGDSITRPSPPPELLRILPLPRTLRSSNVSADSAKPRRKRKHRRVERRLAKEEAARQRLVEEEALTAEAEHQAGIQAQVAFEDAEVQEESALQVGILEDAQTQSLLARMGPAPGPATAGPAEPTDREDLEYL
ncbi:hypothetical protein DFH07DRAFT_778245 [Mycena maculata]|uniref:Uncharacterized protein n=1 Tax=Mycena maculata TaxID=230809 RepID=A0AAD7IDY2_9AGAR|nr:hypothetical protein DFH07DRAFT_778245 [Mycena maculata]